MSIRLSEDEAWKVLAESHTGILTTLRADGAPVTLPIWFVVDDRSICFMTFKGTKKLTRIANDPRASFLVESGERWAELRAVHLNGRIEEIADEPERERIDAALDAKYAPFRTARAEMPDSAKKAYAAKRSFRFLPDPRILTWDNARLEAKGSG
jgi:PPOX class probable F420-dependent enzyme